MNCPFCSKEDTKVIDSRVASDGLSIRRRRECESCSGRFSTYEEVEILDLVVAKRDGRTEPYAREKLEVGLHKALEKRPISHDEFRQLVSEIEQDIQKKTENSKIESKEIGNIVVKKLKKFDQVAYIRFASVYRQFEDIEEFKKELQKL
ncbi:MAG: transcriptional regulator NrdR [Candidatus Doudnabacteria bacterium RIFCSPHIGHO2_02_FULL_48_21]|uniref:Transcriptional repressor NrdR n=1 Tax=Candidatus Doudnabacteria bacterium RIFCSPLOWO2_02_FULL_48_13 TaxID=1817845 RepID=A0A1F5Q9U8_9BACT|nr:MAG: transcriptional regulator NrdR [Candidatus Doudnabacteria bacterium RIFCSPHIGHO2_01_48_18]OGE78032.1 MAG: transcriptional regulator NrdR [Candidatus Doudnabacteria bacterium RIFCSPHIGHO2_01_FULL_48_180]OGE91369.1 MAG: transcriptional regulator NrdR [Candidatus Doudnabacteria bacterium RIFCSPHIGHO2_12_FULL_47_25]OGE93181.1 MAG: transcriptional regulator NrdR [Candidatus Doudnabacteria bacterium RIFCSPHIGHO2_02_FULL_48_21]OGE96702.1 MAG: transcriptional regulator NrdR [Candidatus Doudnaba